MFSGGIERDQWHEIGQLHCQRNALGHHLSYT